MGPELVRGLGAAVTLLTRVPVATADWDRRDLSRSVKWMPFVGGIIGLAIAGAYVALASLMPATIAAGLAVTFGVLLTGAFHEDGLADTVDAFGGGTDRDDILRIMKDPRHGTYGVLALVLSVVVRVVALATLGSAAALTVLPAAHALSRGCAIGLMAAFPPAVGEGLGAAHADPGVRRQVVVGIMFSVGVGLVTLGWWVGPFAVLAAAGAAMMGLRARKHISGYTGDVLGATQQLAEISLMVLGASLASSGRIGTAWWA
jgi:adenosylcobinamide-GDP ribazoletransferase